MVFNLEGLEDRVDYNEYIKITGDFYKFSYQPGARRLLFPQRLVQRLPPRDELRRGAQERCPAYGTFHFHARGVTICMVVSPWVAGETF